MLIDCPECGKKVSLKAPVCPQCGYPVKEILAEKSASSKRKLKMIIGFVGVAILILTIGIFFISNVAIARCLVENCTEKKNGDSEYCIKHTCMLDGCNEYKDSSNEYCIKHTCMFDGCNKYKDSFNEYCTLHEIVLASFSKNTAKENAASVLKISDVQVTSNSSYTICTGRLTNKGNRTYTFVEVKGSFQDSKGKVLDTDWTYAVGSEGLEPGESTTFRMSVKKDYQISSCKVSLLDYD